MALLAVQEQGLRVGVRGDALTVLSGEHVARKLAVHEVDEVHLYGNTELTPQARRLLTSRGVDVLYFTSRGTYQARLVSRESSHAELRRAQFRRLDEPEFALDLARRFVEGKLRNQRAVLQRAQRSHPAEDLSGAIAALRVMLREVSAARDLDTLRGLEGYGSAMYFRGFGQAIRNEEFVFAGRNRRPPRDPVNACLSFGYTLLLQRVETAVRKAGLDVYMGALHTPGRGKPAAPLDLMEELRPVVVDRLVLRLVNRRQLAPDDFEDPGIDDSRIAAPDDGEQAEDGEDPARPVYLARTGRAVFLRALGDTWRTRYLAPNRDGRFKLSDIADQQALLLARCLQEGRSDYAPFLVR